MQTQKRKYWSTPDSLMTQLHDVFQFDYDPCPNPRPAEYDGLTAEWGLSNWVNPPFNNLMPWARKSIKEYHNGKNIVFAVPFYASNCIAYLCENGGRIQYLGRVRWHDLENGDLQPQAPSRLTVMALVILGYEYPEGLYFTHRTPDRILYTV